MVAFVHQSERGVMLTRVGVDGDEVHPPVTLGFIRSYPAWTREGDLYAGDERGTLLRWPRGGGTPEVLSRTRPGLVIRYVAPFSDGDVYAVWREGAREQDDVLGLLRQGAEPREIHRDVEGTQAGIVASERNDAVYYLRPAGSTTELMRLDRASGAIATVPGNLSISGGFDLSDDGKRLVYSTCREFRYLGRVRRAPAGKPPAPAQELLARSEWNDLNPTAAGPRHMFFSSDRSGKWQVWLFDLETGVARAFGGPDTIDAAISPDGKWVVYASSGADQGLRITAWEGGAERALTRGVGDARPRFTHDGRWIVFQRTSPDGVRVFRIPVEGGEGEVRPISPAGGSLPAPSPTEDRIAFLVPKEGGAQPMLTDVAGVEAVPVPGLQPGTYTSVRFSPDGERLLLVRKSTELVEVAIDGATPPELVWKTELDGVDTAEYAPDGDGFIVSSGAWDGDLWLAEGEFR
jgi:dipeptidyl aminopeptidase/acylaminoacyl peptidase